MHRVVQEIQEDNEWRDGDFAKFKKNIASLDQALWNRMCVPMIYAHWEGFVISSLKILITYLNTLEINPSNIPTNLVVVCLDKSYRSLSGKQSFQQKIEFTDRFKAIFEKNIKFSGKINTKSNLSSKVLCEICTMFDFDYEKFKTITRNLDMLIRIRNSIAHGENAIIPSKENINNYIKTVNEATDIFLNEIEIFLVNEKYKVEK